MLILHGEDQVASREFFNSLKTQAGQSGKNILEYSGLGLKVTDLVTALNTSSLTGAATSIYITELFTRRTGADQQSIIRYLRDHPGCDVTVWEPKNISNQFKEFPASIVRKFDLPKFIFKFLENLSWPSLRLALNTSDPELIFYLLVAHVNKLIMAKDAAGDFPSWQAAKLKIQSSKYTFDELITMNDELLSIDFHLKTSQLPYDLNTALELWLMKNISPSYGEDTTEGRI